jgi:excisionase family DNA binding protein
MVVPPFLIDALRASPETKMAQIMTTKELAEYLNLHEITVGKYAAQGRIPAVRIGKRWRFDKNAIDEWIGGDQGKTGGDKDA